MQGLLLDHRHERPEPRRPGLGLPTTMPTSTPCPAARRVRGGRPQVHIHSKWNHPSMSSKRARAAASSGLLRAELERPGRDGRRVHVQPGHVREPRTLRVRAERPVGQARRDHHRRGDGHREHDAYPDAFLPHTENMENMAIVPPLPQTSRALDPWCCWRAACASVSSRMMFYSAFRNIERCPPPRFL